MTKGGTGKLDLSKREAGQMNNWLIEQWNWVGEQENIVSYDNGVSE
jgi:hypothetical protein